jgi:hypothetical protein
MKQITIYEYIATNVPSDAHFVINKYGGSYKRARNVKELEAQLKDFVKKNGKQGLLALAEIHPDKELVLLVDTKANFNDSEQLPKFSNATGDSVITKTDNEQLTYSKILILGGFLLLGIAIITKK